MNAGAPHDRYLPSTLRTMCHLCGSICGAGMNEYEFGLTLLTKNERNWKGFLKGVGISMVTAPIFGVMIFSDPFDQNREGYLARLTLRFCDRCKRDRQNFLGAPRITREDCMKHPDWQELQTQGFTEFLSQQALARRHPR